MKETEAVEEAVGVKEVWKRWTTQERGNQERR